MVRTSTSLPRFAVCLLGTTLLVGAQNYGPSGIWPQGAGPNGNWSATGPEPPRQFSATTGTNILWRTPLPETGQGGIAVVADRVYVATMAPWNGTGLDPDDAVKYAHAVEKREVVGKHIDGHCLDAATGKLLWTRRIEGTVPSIYGYPFSDATSASPVADADHVWFTNAGGRVVCFTRDGEEVWHRDFTPTYDGPFNKQFEPFLVDDRARGKGAKTFVHMEPFEAPDGKGRWHYLVGLDAATGEELWRSEDALTHYNAPTLVLSPYDAFAVHARGGPHAVPERPVGISFTRLTGVDAGRRMWRYDDPRGNHEAALQTMTADSRHVYWLLRDDRNALVVLDLKTGKELRAIPLTKGVDRTTFDAETDSFVTEKGVDLDQGVFPARYSMHAANDCVFFQCYATAWGKPTIGPPYSFCRVRVGDEPVADNVWYFEVPTGVHREDGVETLRWRTKRQARAINSRGEEVTGDQRSRWDGWDWVFNGSPTQVNDHLYYTLATGAVYVLEAGAWTSGSQAFVALNDLGPDGETWTANSISYARGRLYHRTARELLCIGEK
ncbi:MAG: PQQ-binding-like beta-propeller repeat protein [Planctomycetes bacterium]|nr:PQQ-binding-like beta-propeller repeat protein [Planctomycetota bacterium]